MAMRLTQAQDTDLWRTISSTTKRAARSGGRRVRGWGVTQKMIGGAYAARDKLAAPSSTAAAAATTAPAQGAPTRDAEPRIEATASEAESAMRARPGRSRSKAKLEAELDRLRQLTEVEREVAASRPARPGEPRFEDLALTIPPARRGRLDRDDLDESTLDEDELAYRRDGFLIKEGLIPDSLTQPYLAERLAIDDDRFSVWGGSYMGLPSMRDVCLYPPLVELVERLIGQQVGLFLTLSGVRSSRREWHQDFYLKAGYENVHYCAAWIALDDVHPDSGPYEYVPGSHRLPTLRKELVDEWLTPEERGAIGAPRISERFVTRACNEMIRERGLEVRAFTPRRGDVLIWHHSLLHQGSRANDPSLVRPGLIAHYNAVSTLESCKKTLVRHPGGGHYVERHDRDAVLAGRAAAQEAVDRAKAQQRARDLGPGGEVVDLSDVAASEHAGAAPGPQ